MTKEGMERECDIIHVQENVTKLQQCLFYYTFSFFTGIPLAGYKRACNGGGLDFVCHDWCPFYVNKC